MGGFCFASVPLVLFTIGMSSAHSCLKPQMLCPFGGESWRGSCYKLLNETLSWHAGRLKCKNMGGEMVMPSSSEENTYIVDQTAEPLWINCNDFEMERQWDCASENGGYLNWNRDEPNGGTDENCVELMAGIWWGRGTWNDNDCSNEFQVICKGEEVVATQVKLKQWRLLASCLTGHTLREIPTSNVRACATVCDYNPRCRSFNVQHFRTGERICQLNNGTRYEADHTQFVKSKKPFTCIYGER
ncbi:C-type lectin lectoxin-Thr1-like [Asterias amurensis]|uniref:C-type lectin lectoxin-Thr1-like n=1 Tax=Asterias amurensis TaxID=7602 RepID=UPI003AB1FD82